MKRPPISESGYSRARVLFAVLLCSFGALFAVLSFAANPAIETGQSAERAISGASPLIPTSGPGWSKVTAGDLTSGSLQAVTCTSALQCWAVGYANSDTLIEQWNGTSWSVVASPNKSATSYNTLTSVACSSASQCWAVGYYGNGGGELTLIEQWNGSSWAIVASPNPAGTNYNILNGVTCTSATQCWAVGYYVDSSGFYQNLIEQWNGTSWSIVTLANSNVDDFLLGVTCSSASQCWAVGYYVPYNSFGDQLPNQTLIVQWNGTSWSFVASPNTNVSQPNGLNGVTCFSASQCWAVGSYYDGTANHTLTEQWNGTSWSIVTSPNTSSTQHNYLLGVTCPSATQCWAVGEYINGANDQTLIEQWNGTSWSIATSPNTSSTQDNNLRGVTCTSATQCWAVGSYFADNGTIERTLIEQWNGSAWSIIASPNASPRSVLNGVNCTSASNCWAVGYYGTINQTLIEQWNGTAWTRIISRNLNPSGINTNYLQGINCTSASQCWAVGAYVSTNVYQTLVERWNGTSWSIVASPNISSSHGDNLANVACASASQCFTVGNYLDSALNAHPLVEQWDGTTWSIVTPPSNNTQQSVLSGVTCPSASQCWAVGYYTAGSGFSAQYQTFVIHWDGTSWSIVASPDTSTTQLNILNAVTCNSTSDCWTVGYYQNSSFIYQTLIEHWDGSAWSVVSSPNSGTQSNYFNGITCSSASDCWAAGYDGVNGSYQTLTEHWDGTSWSIVTSLNPGGSNNNVLNGVACSSASLCWAVGDYNNGSTDQNLIEVYSPSIPPLMSVGSRMTHGAAGTFDVNLPLVGTRGIECRSSATLGAGNYTVVFTFINNVTNCGSAGTTGGSVSNGPLGNQCTENLTGVPNTQYTSVTLNNVVDFENNSGNVSVPMGVLIGDTTANGAVNSSDVAQTQSQSGQPVNSTNFREDVTVNGSINSSDVALVQSKSGTALPAGVSQSQDATTPAPKHRGSPGKSF